MSRRINVIIDDDTWGFLGRVPAGECSRIVNDALRAWATHRRRADAVRAMSAMSKQLPSVSTAEVVHWIRNERNRLR